ncbi:MAG: DUF2161 family putative PD-(D/E)XK-type phosphodiesterase [Alphaproteobacteria bacterium]|nr:DUF2161 family putative PD-(D/E)XK-type phosphodiesterase [Alphaproteobacteria bacterium]
MAETDLALPVKAFLEGLGYEVKSEVEGCDLVARRGDEPPVVVELKQRLTLGLVLQAVDRLAVAELVYLAVPAEARRDTGPYDRRVRKLCRLIGFGLLVIARRTGRPTVEVLEEPGPYRPRQDPRRRRRLLREFDRRQGDPNIAGSTGVKLVTAYRQAALRLADALNRQGSASPRELAAATGITDAARILQRDVYGWFARLERGRYTLSPAGFTALDAFRGSFAGVDQD